MRLRALIHLTEIARAISRHRRIVVLGSSSLLATYSDLGEAGQLLEPSLDADLLIEGCDDELAAVLNEAIGGDSLFQTREGYYADFLRDAVKDSLPLDWESRLVPLADCAGVFCLEPHDLAVAKLHASRPKDLAVLSGLLATGRLDAATVRERLGQTRMREALIVRTYDGLAKAEQMAAEKRA